VLIEVPIVWQNLFAVNLYLLSKLVFLWLTNNSPKLPPQKPKSGAFAPALKGEAFVQVFVVGYIGNRNSFVKMIIFS
jgi:hypothetical protein